MTAAAWYIAAAVGAAAGGAIGAMSLPGARGEGAAIGALLGAGFGLAMRATVRHELPARAS
jgi:hypothetical protein